MKKPIHKIFFFLALSALLITSGFGCKGLNTIEQAATQPVVLEYWTVFDDVDALTVLINKYRAVRPNITVNLRQLRMDEFYPRLLEALAEDKGPDIISVSNRAIKATANKLAKMPASFSDTTMVVTQGTLNSTTKVNTTQISLPDVNRLDKEYVQAVKKDAAIGSDVYGLPLSMDTMAIYYNKDLLDRSGVAEPPKTWEAFQTAAKKITRYDKTTSKVLQAGAALGTGNNIPGSDDLLYILFKQSGVEFVDGRGAAIFNATPNNYGGGDTPAMTAMNFYTDFADSTRDTYSWNESMGNALDQFVNGSVGFFFGYSHQFPIIRARAPQLNFGVMPMLQLSSDHPVNTANYWLQAVTLKSKHQNEAWGLVGYLTHSAATKEYLDKTGRPTALRAYITDQSAKPELAPFVAQVLTADNWYHGADYASASKSVNEMIHAWLLPPTQPDRLIEFRQDILNKGAAKVNQTL
ncbi:MAG: extracellular solute-binding protein [bacterium]|nr:extracellular solute-binding protein [bacterium]